MHTGPSTTDRPIRDSPTPAPSTSASRPARRPSTPAWPIGLRRWISRGSLGHRGGGVDIGAYESIPDSTTPSARGPLGVHPTNPRYFTGGSGKAVYLTGSHTWSNLQDIDHGGDTPSLAFLGGFAGYLDNLVDH